MSRIEQLRNVGQAVKQFVANEEVNKRIDATKETARLTLSDPKAIGLALLTLGLSGTAAVFLARTIIAAERALSEEQRNVVKEYMSTLSDGVESVLSTVRADDVSLKDKVVGVGQTAFEHARKADGEILSALNVLRRDKKVRRNAIVTAVAGAGAAVSIYAYSRRVSELRKSGSSTK